MKVILLLTLIIIGVVIFFLLNLFPFKGENDLPLTQEIMNLSPINVSVLNGVGISGFARDYSNYLLNYNVDVMSIGNAELFIYDKSIIVVKNEEASGLEDLKRITKIDRVIYAFNNDVNEDFYIITGRDLLEFLYE